MRASRFNLALGLIACVAAIGGAVPNAPVDLVPSDLWAGTPRDEHKPRRFKQNQRKQRRGR